MESKPTESREDRAEREADAAFLKAIDEAGADSNVIDSLLMQEMHRISKQVHELAQRTVAVPLIQGGLDPRLAKQFAIIEAHLNMSDGISQATAQILCSRFGVPLRLVNAEHLNALKNVARIFREQLVKQQTPKVIVITGREGRIAN